MCKDYLNMIFLSRNRCSVCIRQLQCRLHLRLPSHRSGLLGRHHLGIRRSHHPYKPLARGIFCYRKCKPRRPYTFEELDSACLICTQRNPMFYCIVSCRKAYLHYLICTDCPNKHSRYYSNLDGHSDNYHFLYKLRKPHPKRTKQSTIDRSAHTPYRNTSISRCYFARTNCIAFAV